MKHCLLASSQRRMVRHLKRMLLASSSWPPSTSSRPVPLTLLPRTSAIRDMYLMIILRFTLHGKKRISIGEAICGTCSNTGPQCWSTCTRRSELRVKGASKPTLGSRLIPCCCKVLIFLFLAAYAGTKLTLICSAGVEYSFSIIRRGPRGQAPLSDSRPQFS